MKKNFLCLAILLTLHPFQTSMAQSEKPLGDNQRITLELFEEACLKHTKDKAAWADKQEFLKKAEILDQESFASMGQKLLSYPESDKTLNMWGVSNNYIMLYELENFGCLVTSDGFIEPEDVKGFLEKIRDQQTKLFNANIKIDHKIDEKNNGFMSLATFSPDPKGSTSYILVRTYPDSTNPNLRTYMYFFRSKKDVSF